MVLIIDEMCDVFVHTAHCSYEAMGSTFAHRVLPGIDRSLSAIKITEFFGSASAAKLLQQVCAMGRAYVIMGWQVICCLHGAGSQLLTICIPPRRGHCAGVPSRAAINHQCQSGESGQGSRSSWQGR